MNWLFDDRTKCWSVQTTMFVHEYLDLVREAHETQGAIAGQRDVLTTTTAKRIRNRMVSDIRQGAVLPPVVIGVVLPEGSMSRLPLPEAESIHDLSIDSTPATLSIIDGMQRTASILEAATQDAAVLDREIRVEYWVTTSVRSLIYRMLVLNTGQVPWTINRQLSVVYAPLLTEILANVPELEKVSTPDDRRRRTGGGQYSSEHIVELYIAFSLRKTAVDTKEAVSDEFSRLDFVENLSDSHFQSQFYEALSMLAKLDKAFSKYEGGGKERFAKGKAIFDGQPARIGFVVAVAMNALGRPGADRPAAERTARMTRLRRHEEKLLKRLEAMNSDELGDYLRLDVLAEVLNVRVGQVGRYERSMFSEAFKTLIDEEFEMDNLEACWRAN